jgi:hypothetical protein
MKIFIDFPFPPLEAIKHVILLASYQGKWFIIDSNGGDTDYYKGCNFSKVLSELKITLCKNGVYEQIGNGCDTCSSINSYVLSAYLAKNGKLPLLPNGDIDFSKIYHFAKEENIFPLPLFFVETQEF